MIYVHIPFCRSFCTYCDFYSEVATKCRKAEEAQKQEALFEDFTQALACEIRSRAGEITDDVNTLYIGGGTPSVLPLSAFRKIVAELASLGHGTPRATAVPDYNRGAASVSVQGRSLHGMPFDEFTVEVNPEDIVEKGHAYVEGLLELGVNRISMGVQSFDDSILKFMNRRHSAAEAVRAYAILEEAGVQNISIDLIFGLPQLSMDQWRETLDKALSISSRGVLPQHISSYQLSVESGSMLARLVEKGKWSEASEEVCQAQYSELCSVLASAGYHHYEISNFAQPGFEARHNSAYWNHVPYVGLGPGAHSYINKSLPVRQWNQPDLQAYIDAGRSAYAAMSSPVCADALMASLPGSFRDSVSDPFKAVRDGETLDEDQLALECIMLGLRTSSGVPESFLRAHCDPAALSRALSLGHLVPASVVSSLRIPERHFFISDAIIADLV